MKSFVAHPGEMLKEYLEEIGISAYQLSKATGISQSYFSELFKGKKSITARTSILLGKFFSLNEEYWLKIQNHYDILEQKRKLKDKIKAIKPFKQIQDAA
jgi:antitoxin HigA-1